MLSVSLMTMSPRNNSGLSRYSILNKLQSFLYIKNWENKDIVNFIILLSTYFYLKRWSL